MAVWSITHVLGGATADTRRVGIYHWGGSALHSVADGVEWIADVGARVARVSLSPRYLRDYGISGNCLSGFTLAGAASDPDWIRALSNTRIDVTIITAYDGTTFGDCELHRYLNPEFYTPPNRAALVKEYSDFTLFLYRRFRGSYKRFILSTWEGDNAVYCGQAYSYAEDAGFRQRCQAGYRQTVGVDSPEVALQGLKLWLQARYEGIADGRRRAEAEGIGGMRVYSAPEISLVRCLRNHGYASVLHDVLPYVAFDYVSYSAYESINAPDPGTVLRQDLETIRDVAGTTAIILGETGFCRQRWGGAAISRADEVIRAALDWGVEYVIHWQLLDQSKDEAFGLYDASGLATPYEQYFRQLLEPGRISGAWTLSSPGLADASERSRPRTVLTRFSGQ